MHKLGKGSATHKVRAAWAVTGTLLLAGAHTALAQTSAPPASSPSNDNAPSEAARRAALSPYRFILQNASAPRKAPAAAPAASPSAPAQGAAPVEAKRAPAPPSPVQHASAQPSAQTSAVPAPKPAASPEPTPVLAPSAPVAPAPAPEPAAAALTRPAEPAPRREIVAIQTDEPRLSPALLREQPKGVVKVHFDIQPNGTVSDVQVLASSNRVLNRPTVEAVQGWKFQPVDEVLTVETELVYKFGE